MALRGREPRCKSNVVLSTLKIRYGENAFEGYPRVFSIPWHSWPLILSKFKDHAMN